MDNQTKDLKLSDEAVAKSTPTPPLNNPRFQVDSNGDVRWTANIGGHSVELILNDPEHTLTPEEYEIVSADAEITFIRVADNGPDMLECLEATAAWRSWGSPKSESEEKNT